MRYRFEHWVLLGIMIGCLASCALVLADPRIGLHERAPMAPRAEWNGVRSWSRQDNGCNFDHLERSKFDMITISSRCVKGSELEAHGVARLKRNKWMLVYLDVARISEAEPRVWPKMVNARSNFIAGAPTVWDAYPVDVTSEGWFRVLETIIRDDLERGYDGFWLDDCAGYWETGQVTRDSIRDHTNLIKRIRALVNSIRPDVKLVCNSDTYLIESDIGQMGTFGKTGNTPIAALEVGRTGFLNALDGVVVEGFTYHLPGPGQFNVSNDSVRRAQQERWFSAVLQRNEHVFTLDFTQDVYRQRHAWQESKRFGFIPAVNRGNIVGAFLN